MHLFFIVRVVTCLFVVRVPYTLIVPILFLYTTYYQPTDEHRLILPSPYWLRNLAILLIDHILNRPYFWKVVRTCTLSKNWLYTCNRIPHEEFDQTVLETVEELTSPTIRFIPIIDCYLRFHIRITLKVTLENTSIKVCPNVDCLI